MYARAGRRPLRSEKLCTRTGNDMLLSTDPIDPQNQDVYALWDQLADFSVADGDAALTHLMSALRTMLSARNVLWGVVVRLPSPKRADPLLGWRPRLVRVLDPVPAVAASVQKQYDTLWSDDVDLSQILSMSGDEPFRVRLLFETLPPAWFEGKHYRRHYLDVGFADSISVRIALNDDLRIRLFVFRDAQQPRFTAQDGQRLGSVMRALRWFHRQQLLSHGLLIANAPLTPAERRVLLGLLAGDTERQIAQKLEQSPNTTHFHVKSIYAKFGVRSRQSLAALWLGKLQ
ncbi:MULTISPECIES: helix-turn-helix transcriptional regulator [unclassified Bradyrhizobium]|uniref:helix-turn-helix transcriptional regulator n=2 Tax=Bradyrhizobium TaxID=374 RepID=UPI001FD8C998|nr:MULTISPECIES: helix-turn-helix transcriptional regulator [unclassified Bradyrhizobium]